jgi:rhodanese-related sulfurtransferase
MDNIPPACPVPRWQLLKAQLKNVDAATFEQLKGKTGHVLIDVRSSDEFAAFHLEDAVNLDYLAPGFLDKMEALDTETIYLVYCQSGRRSVRACTLMKNAGIEKLIHLDGGLNEWER